MSQTIRIVAAVVDVRNLTLYVEDGSTIIIQQGDPRLRKIIEAATPQLIAKGWAEITIGPAEENSYAQFEQQGGGVVKFFRIAKSKLKDLFTAKEAEPERDYPVVALSIGQVPVPISAEDKMPKATTLVTTILTEQAVEGTDEQVEEFEPVVKVEPTKTEQTMSAVEEIMKHAIPVSDPAFHEHHVAKQGNVVEPNGETIKAHDNNDESTDTIIAVVDKKIIPGMERIKTQFSRAAKMGSTQGVENFLKRIASVIEQRKHSIDDLLKFMERGDLPIADDGSILIYKVLRRKGDRSEGRYVDCHSKKVEQWAGAVVCMDHSLVDHNRSNECSNGLHVARRGYIRNFSGDVCVLAKLAPEDVIAVPEYDANKMRVCAYHILMELTDSQYNLIKQNRPLTDDDEGKRLLAQAIAGQHVRRTHEVRITAGNGGGVQVTAITKDESPALVKTPDAPETVTALENLQAETLDEHTSPKEVIAKVEGTSRKDQAAVLYAEYLDKRENGIGDEANAALERLRAFKKAAKVNWEKLGITDTYVISGLPESPRTPPMPKVKPPAPAHKSSKKAKKASAKAKAKKTVPAKQAPKVKTPPQVMQTELDGEDRRGLVYDSPAPTGVTEGSPRERIQKLLAIGLDSTGIAQAILDIKKKSKKSWDTLGVSEAQASLILTKTK